MANEFWNVVVGIIGGVIIGMVLHSAMGHTWGKRLWEIFHRDEKPSCYGDIRIQGIDMCYDCKYFLECENKCHTSTE